MNAVSLKVASIFPFGSPVISWSRSLFFICIALTYGFVLSQLPDQDFKDFNNYLNYAESSSLIALSYAAGGFIEILANEPVWLLINSGLGLFMDPEIVVRTIIFFGASSVVWLILRHDPKQFFWLLLFLFLPQVIKNYLIHLRQGAAITVFLWGWFAVNRSSRWVLIGLTPFIHASFFFIVFLLALTWILRLTRFGPDIKTIIYGFIGIALGLSLGFLAELFGARQAGEYAFERTDVSGLGFLLWAIILIIMLSAGKSWLRDHTFEIGIVTFYLTTYWLVEVTARIFESGLIVVFFAGLALRGWRRYVFLSIMLGAGALAWVLRLGQPGLGFA
jgi:hypothetical protein